MISKIVKIALQNFKAIEDSQMIFEGMSAIITGGNNKGKTSFLRGIVDRIRFMRPVVMVRKGAEEGSGELTLDSGERFVWEFNTSGKDKLTYISREGQKSNVTKALGAEFFPPLFDIDKFLQSTPSDQVKQLQKIVGLDFTEIDKLIDQAYKERYRLNEESERFRVKLSKMLKCERVMPVDTTKLEAKRNDAKDRLEKERARLNQVYRDNKNKNEEVLAAWENAKSKIDQEHDKGVSEWREEYLRVSREVSDFNDGVRTKRARAIICEEAHQTLVAHGYEGTQVSSFIDELKKAIPEFKEVEEKPQPTKSPYPERPLTPDPMPSGETLLVIENEIVAIDANILEAVKTNQRAAEYKEYTDYMQVVHDAEDAAHEAELVLEKYRDQKKEMIASASFPEGISINSEGVITVDGFPMERDQISTSKLYTTALRIASMNLGEVKCLYFDASFLDKNSLRDIYEWADKKGLQLLIERPDFDGGEISYELIEG